MITFRNLGSLYLNEKARPLDVSGNGDTLQYDGETLAIGDTVPGKELRWVPWNGLLVANRCILCNISWEDLNEFGYIFGKPMEIDCQNYLCRSLTVGRDRGFPCEWDKMMSDLSKNNDLWNWRDNWTIGQETATAGEEFRVTRGSISALHRSYMGSERASQNVGFRPVLEPLGVCSADPNSLIGRKVKIWGPNWLPVDGVLVDASDYDLVLDTPTALLNARGWSLMDSERTILDRTRANWLKEVEG